MNDVPCYECLVLPMCRSRLGNNLGMHNVWRAIEVLSRSCPKLEEFISANDNYNYSLKNRHHTVLFLTGIDLRKRYHYEL